MVKEHNSEQKTILKEAVKGVVMDQLAGMDLQIDTVNSKLDEVKSITMAERECESRAANIILIHDLLFFSISTIESAVGYSLITHCCISRLACSHLSEHIEPHSPDFKREINTTTMVMN